MRFSKRRPDCTTTRAGADLPSKPTAWCRISKTPGSQQKIVLRLIATLRPHLHRDPGLPTRIQELFAANRSFGSRDRRLYRELIYTTLRFLPWIESLLDQDADGASKAVAWLAADL